jgi:hypothetical protein
MPAAPDRVDGLVYRVFESHQDGRGGSVMSELIPEAERARRLEAITFARWSVRLEGFTLSDEVEAIFQRYVNGKLTEDAYTRAIQRVAGVTPSSTLPKE